jgi:hypothetical protein
MTQELVTIPEAEAFEFLQMQRAPARVIDEARQAAIAIQQIIKGKPKPVMMNGEQYLEYEDWQTVGRFYGITAEIEWTRYCEYGGASGFEARAVAKHAASGRIISAGESMCLNDEPRWSARPKYEYVDEVDANGKKQWVDYSPEEAKKKGRKGCFKSKRVQVGEEQVPLAQLRSMAQTRAGAKALRNVLAWVVVLAGYKTTPAEELETERDGNGGHRVDEREPAAKEPLTPPQERQAPSTAGEQGGTGEAVISEPQAKRFFAIAKTAGHDDGGKAWLSATFGIASDREIPRRRYEEIVKALQDAH